MTWYERSTLKSEIRLPLLAALTAALARLCRGDTLLAVCSGGDKFRMAGRRRSDEQLSGGLRLSLNAISSQ